MDLNKAMIIGRLTRDPELRTIPSGVQVANFSIATNRMYTDPSGNKQQTVEFHDIVVWRRLAEIAAQYLRKGAKVYIEGRLQTRSWDDPNGFKRYKTEIVTENMIMLDRPSTGGEAGYQSPIRSLPQGAVPVNVSTPPPAQTRQPQPQMQDDLPTIDVTEKEVADEEEISVEDIPF